MKRLITFIIAFSPIISQAQQSCNKVVIKPYGVLYPLTDTNKICGYNYSAFDVIMGHHAETGMIAFDSAQAFEKVGQVLCPNNKKLILLNILYKNELEKDVEKVFGTFEENLI